MYRFQVYESIPGLVAEYQEAGYEGEGEDAGTPDRKTTDTRASVHAVFDWDSVEAMELSEENRGSLQMVHAYTTVHIHLLCS